MCLSEYLSLSLNFILVSQTLRDYSTSPSQPQVENKKPTTTTTSPPHLTPDLRWKFHREGKFAVCPSTFQLAIAIRLITQTLLWIENEKTGIVPHQSISCQPPACKQAKEVRIISIFNIVFIRKPVFSGMVAQYAHALCLTVMIPLVFIAHPRVAVKRKSKTCQALRSV